MSDLLSGVLLLAFLVRSIRHSLYQVFLWQLKEYRPDRIISHLKTWQGKRMVWGPFSLVKWLLIMAYFLGLPIFFLVLPVYGFEAFLNFKEMVTSLKKPVFTLKATTVLFLAILGQLTIFFWPVYSLERLAMVVLLLDKLLSPTIALLFLTLSIPTKIQRQLVMEKAGQMIKKHAHLLTIGISGSYGKTSTKEFLSGILSKKFKVLKTVGSNNTDIGIAQTILQGLTNQQIFICEMAAYKRGEIKAICEIVKPKIGIITAINEQHLDLFGSLENTMKAKFELIEALPKNGLAIFNGNNQYTRQLAEKARKMGLSTFIYRYIDRPRSAVGDITAKNIKVYPEKIEFTVQIGQETEKLTTPLLGKQNVENILAAMVVAHQLGMSFREIASAIKTLSPPEMTMKPVLGPAGSTLIDDTFNANPDGVLAALEYLNVYRGKKILVFQPMIELGEAASRLHQEVGEVAAKICDLIFLTNKNFYESLSQGAALVKNGVEKIFLLPQEEIMAKIKENLSQDAVVVFEGKETRKYLEELKSR